MSKDEWADQKLAWLVVVVVVALLLHDTPPSRTVYQIDDAGVHEDGQRLRAASYA